MRKMNLLASCALALAGYATDTQQGPTAAVIVVPEVQ